MYVATHGHPFFCPPTPSLTLTLTAGCAVLCTLWQDHLVGLEALANSVAQTHSQEQSKLQKQQAQAHAAQDIPCTGRSTHAGAGRSTGGGGGAGAGTPLRAKPSHTITGCRSIQREPCGIKIACTKKTRSLLLSEPKYSALQHLEFCLWDTPDLGQSRELHLDGKKINVTALDAMHCPGSCMFLIEGFSRTVLYTGDFRFEHDPQLSEHGGTNASSSSVARNTSAGTVQHKRLFGIGDSSPIVLDLVIMDCTFLTTHKMHRTMPTRLASYQRLEEKTLEILRTNPHLDVHVCAGMLGYEPMLKYLGQSAQSDVLHRAICADPTHQWYHTVLTASFLLEHVFLFLHQAWCSSRKG